MASHQPFTLYSPNVQRENNYPVPAKELRDKITQFFTLYNPAKVNAEYIDSLLDVARVKGVLALKTQIKKKYHASIDEADASELGWTRIYSKLVEFYKFYGQQKDTRKVFFFTKNQGLKALDVKLKETYGESLSEFMQRGLLNWKSNWHSFLKNHHKDSVSYELQRFYKFIESRQSGSASYREAHPLQRLVAWACNHSRLEVNQRLLEKYNYCLDDVTMVPGNTLEERKTNLKFQLVEFYQEHDPERLGSLDHSINDKETPEMKALDQEAEWGYINLESLELMLKQRYGVGLTDSFTNELRSRLVEFYESVGVVKTSDSIEKIIYFAKRQGLQEMNEKLMVTYGKGISLDGL